MIAPNSLPKWFSIASLISAFGVWCISQYLALKRAKTAYNAQIASELELLRSKTVESINQNDLVEAQHWLEVALAVRDDDEYVWRDWASLMTRKGKWRQARHCWNITLKLCDDPTLQREAINAIQQLPAGS